MRRPAIAIAVRGLVTLASRPHRAVRAAMVTLLVTDHADRVRATRSVVGLLEPVGGEHRVEHAHAGDQAKLDGDDEHEPGERRGG